MQTARIQADVLQQPPSDMVGGKIFLPYVDLDIDCKNLKFDFFFFLALSLAWLGILIWWCSLNWRWYTHQLTLMQRVLIVIPVLKLIDVFSYYLFIGECPWITEETEYQSKYLIMGLVTISSIYQSVAMGLFMMISCGWTLLYNEVSREI